MRELARECSDEDVAATLNREGRRSAKGEAFNFWALRTSYLAGFAPVDQTPEVTRIELGADGLIIGCSREGSPQVRLTCSASSSRGGRFGTLLPSAKSIPSARASSLRRPVRWSADTAMPPCRRAIASPAPSPRRSILVEDEQRRALMPMSCSTRRTASMRGTVGRPASTTWRKRRDRQPAEPPDTSLAPRDPSAEG